MEQQQSPILQEHIILYVFRAPRPDYSVYHLSGTNNNIIINIIKYNKIIKY